MNSPRKRRGAIFLLVAAVLGALTLVAPMPYVIEMPGPSWNTLGVSSVKNDDGSTSKIPLISVTGAPVYPTTGELDLLTVSVAGSPTHRPLLGDVIRGWLNPEYAVVPMDLVFPPDESEDDRNAENAAAMVDSQREAIAAAFTERGYDVSQLKVDKLDATSPLVGKLQAGDIIETVNGKKVANVVDMRAALAANGVDKAATIVALRGATTITVSAKPVLSDPAADGTRVPVMKILGSSVYTFPFDVKIRLDDVGGPSAGLMFSLGVLDVITPGELTGGRKIAGTGTIDSSGTVGPIGGIRQKMFGAKAAGASYVLVPAANCPAAFGNVPSGLRAFKVSTLDDALAALKVIAQPDDAPGRAAALDALPACTK